MNSDFETALKELVKNAVREVAAELRDEVGASIPHQVPRATPSEDRLLLTPRETAKRLAISERHLFELTRTGQLPCVRVGRNVRCSVETIQKWVRDTESTDQPSPTEKAERSKRSTKAAASESPRRKPKVSEGSNVRRPLVVTAPATERQPATARQLSPKGKRQENQERISPLTVLLSEMGIDRTKLPPITNGELMRIAEVDTPTLHGWQYLNRSLPEEAINKLKNHFRRLVAEQRGED